MLSGLFADLGDAVSIAMETNGRASLGFIVELPGAFVRGKTQSEVLSKVNTEAKSYLDWLGIPAKPYYQTLVIQRHRCTLMVEDADSEILLDEDKRAVTRGEFEKIAELVIYSGKTFLQLYRSAKLKDWVDEARIGKTFYGERPKTIREIFDHVKLTQYYYLSRTSISFKQNEQSFIRIRKNCLEKLKKLFEWSGNSVLFNLDNEKWTLKKILRRFVWHDRIHGKAIVRILEKQKQLGIISAYPDTFSFALTSA